MKLNWLHKSTNFKPEKIMKIKFLRRLVQLCQETHANKVIAQTNNQKLSRIEKSLNQIHLNELLTLEEICTTLHISQMTLRRLRTNFDLKSFCSGHKIYLSERDVINALKRHNNMIVERQNRFKNK
ncbi:DNA-binding protein [Puteibacter caeruleilacunae]|nr:DNA-binding protein [Puteibacter caeruleilacunae]